MTSGSAARPVPLVTTAGSGPPAAALGHPGFDGVRRLPGGVRFRLRPVGRRCARLEFAHGAASDDRLQVFKRGDGLCSIRFRLLYFDQGDAEL